MVRSSGIGPVFLATGFRRHLVPIVPLDAGNGLGTGDC